MVGFGLEGYEERVPCPHCGSTDCAGVQYKTGHEGDPKHAYLVCVATGKRVTKTRLKESAKSI